MTREAAATVKTFEDMDKTVKRRRRMNKAAVHRQLTLLRRDVDVFASDFGTRLAALAQLTFYEGPTDFRHGELVRLAAKTKRSSRGGRRVQRGKRNRAARDGEEGVEPRNEANPIFDPRAAGGQVEDKARRVAGIEWVSHREMGLGRRKRCRDGRARTQAQKTRHGPSDPELPRTVVDASCGTSPLRGVEDAALVEMERKWQAAEAECRRLQVQLAEVQAERQLSTRKPAPVQARVQVQVQAHVPVHVPPQAKRQEQAPGSRQVPPSMRAVAGEVAALLEKHKKTGVSDAKRPEPPVARRASPPARRPVTPPPSPPAQTPFITHIAGVPTLGKAPAVRGPRKMKPPAARRS